MGMGKGQSSFPRKAAMRSSPKVTRVVFSLAISRKRSPALTSATGSPEERRSSDPGPRIAFSAGVSFFSTAVTKAFHASSALEKTFCAGASAAHSDRYPMKSREAARITKLPRLIMVLASGCIAGLSFDRLSAMA